MEGMTKADFSSLTWFRLVKVLEARLQTQRNILENAQSYDDVLRAQARIKELRQLVNLQADMESLQGENDAGN